MDATSYTHWIIGGVVGLAIVLEADSVVLPLK